MNRQLPELHIEGVALWAPRLPGWSVAAGVMRGDLEAPEATASRPTPALLAPTERRRAPDTVAVALEVASGACEAAGRSPKELPSVFASTHGDLAISDYMCATLVATPTLLSPIKFHNSVHNAAAGYWSIGTGSYAPYTAISAFNYTFAAGLLETATHVACEQRPVLYVAFDIEAKGALATVAPSRGVLGVALVIGPKSSGAARAMRLSLHPGAAEPTPARSRAAALMADNALAPALPLFEALARDEPASLTFALSAGAALQVKL
ncbi:MAG: beta-ketoacyl synthase chain length factor [Steroidobacter sp.]